MVAEIKEVRCLSHLRNRVWHSAKHVWFKQDFGCDIDGSLFAKDLVAIFPSQSGARAFHDE